MLLAPRSAWCGGVRFRLMEDLREERDRFSVYWHLRSSVNLASNFKRSSEKGLLTLAFWGPGPDDQLALVSEQEDGMMQIRVIWLA